MQSKKGVLVSRTWNSIFPIGVFIVTDPMKEVLPMPNWILAILALEVSILLEWVFS